MFETFGLFVEKVITANVPCRIKTGNQTQKTMD